MGKRHRYIEPNQIITSLKETNSTKHIHLDKLYADTDSVGQPVGMSLAP
jgi:hypothetical protein